MNCYDGGRVRKMVRINVQESEGYFHIHCARLHLFTYTYMLGHCYLDWTGAQVGFYCMLHSLELGISTATTWLFVKELLTWPEPFRGDANFINIFIMYILFYTYFTLCVVQSSSIKKTNRSD